MLNVVVLTGKIVELPVLKETVNGTKYATIALEITRPFMNSNSVYDSDRIHVTLWKGVAETAMNICNVGDLLGIKARVQSYHVEKDEHTYYNYEFVAEQVSYLKTEA